MKKKINLNCPMATLEQKSKRFPTVRRKRLGTATQKGGRQWKGEE